MKLYTKRGDDGSTSLVGGRQVSKDNLRVAAYGDVDEANAAVGVVIATCDDDKTGGILRQIQSELFVLGTQLATLERDLPQAAVSEDQVTQLERWIDEASDETPPMNSFILPGGSATAAALHSARTVVRRAERTTVALALREPVAPAVMAYLNRLSDLLFALARQANHRAGVAEIPWTKPRT